MGPSLASSVSRWCSKKKENWQSCRYGTLRKAAEMNIGNQWSTGCTAAIAAGDSNTATKWIEVRYHLSFNDVAEWGGGGTSTDTSMVGFKSQQLLNKILADMAVTIWHERGYFSCIVSQCCMAIATTLQQTHQQCTRTQERSCSKSVYWTVKNTVCIGYSVGLWFMQIYHYIRCITTSDMDRLHTCTWPSCTGYTKMISARRAVIWRTPYMTHEMGVLARSEMHAALQAWLLLSSVSSSRFDLFVLRMKLKLSVAHRWSSLFCITIPDPFLLWLIWFDSVMPSLYPIYCYSRYRFTRYFDNGKTCFDCDFFEIPSL